MFCWFNIFHKWGKWMDISAKDGYADPFAKQLRRCAWCNKVQTRYTNS